MGNMVPYRTGSTQTRSYSACDSSTGSTTGYRDWGNDDGWVTFTAVLKEEDLSLPFLKLKPHFDRIVKARNTGGRLFKPMVWKPIKG